MLFELADKLQERTGLRFYDGEAYPLPKNILNHFEYLLDKIEKLEVEMNKFNTKEKKGLNFIHTPKGQNYAYEQFKKENK